MENYDDVFIGGETYENKKTKKIMFVMAVSSIDSIEAWLAVMQVDEHGNTMDADEVCIKYSEYKDWEVKDFQ